MEVRKYNKFQPEQQSFQESTGILAEIIWIYAAPEELKIGGLLDLELGVRWSAQEGNDENQEPETFEPFARKLLKLVAWG